MYHDESMLTLNVQSDIDAAIEKLSVLEKQTRQVKESLVSSRKPS
jgi:hypothetical protein